MNHHANRFQLQIARTLWHNTYRGKITNEAGEYLATIRVLLGIPLDRSEVPANAPEAAPYLNVQIEDAVLSMEDLIPFEATLSELLLSQLQNDYFIPQYCHFFYPSPCELLTTKSTPLS